MDNPGVRKRGSRQLAVATATTARPLYSPHFGQARCDCLRSPQFGQALLFTGVRKSWLRRFAVRCFEWRRFGLGISNSL